MKTFRYALIATFALSMLAGTAAMANPLSKIFSGHGYHQARKSTGHYYKKKRVNPRNHGQDYSGLNN